MACFDYAGEIHPPFTAAAPIPGMEYEIGSEEAVSEAVMLAVAAVTGREPFSLPPLGEILDTESLNRIFDTQYDGTPRKGGRVEFSFAGCQVRVDNGEYMEVDPVGADFTRTQAAESELQTTD